MTNFSPSILPEDERTRRALEDVYRSLAHEGVSGGILTTPLYDDLRDIAVPLIAGEDSSDGPENITQTGANWHQALLSVTMKMEEGVTYRIYGTASCEAVLDSGSTYSAVAVRVVSGDGSGSSKTTLHWQRGSSESIYDYSQITVPFTEELTTKVADYIVDFDAQLYAQAGADPVNIENLRLIVLAIPVIPVAEEVSE